MVDFNGMSSRSDQLREEKNVCIMYTVSTIY